MFALRRDDARGRLAPPQQWAARDEREHRNSERYSVCKHSMNLAAAGEKCFPVRWMTPI